MISLVNTVFLWKLFTRGGFLARCCSSGARAPRIFMVSSSAWTPRILIRADFCSEMAWRTSRTLGLPPRRWALPHGGVAAAIPLFWRFAFCLARFSRTAALANHGAPRARECCPPAVERGARDLELLLRRRGSGGPGEGACSTRPALGPAPGLRPGRRPPGRPPARPSRGYELFLRGCTA